ncbi:MAG: sorbosone dehydrogenase family protein, partial [Candidatus Korobacteraceae bacterium]
MKRTIVVSTLMLLLAGMAISRFYRSASPISAATSGSSVFTDYRSEKPGATHKITIADLPEPLATRSADNAPEVVDRPPSAWPQAPAGFKVELYASGLDYPRLIRTAPNGDLFLAESRLGEIKVFRG